MYPVFLPTVETKSQGNSPSAARILTILFLICLVQVTRSNESETLNGCSRPLTPRSDRHFYLGVHNNQIALSRDSETHKQVKTDGDGYFVSPPRSSSCRGDRSGPAWLDVRVREEKTKKRTENKEKRHNQ